MKKISTEEYINKLKSKKINIFPIEEYKGTKVSIKHKCSCGNTFIITPSNNYKGNKMCPECSKINKSKNVNRAESKKYIEYLKKQSILVIPLEGYKGAETKIKHRCICGNIWEVSPTHVKKGVTCGCSRKNKTKHSEENSKLYLNYLREQNIKIEPLEKYVSSHTKIKHKCICGNIWDVKPSHIKAGVTCGCSKFDTEEDIKIKHKKYLNKIKTKNINVKVIETYKGIQTKIKHKCTCGNIWSVEPLSILRGSVCKECGYKNRTSTSKSKDKTYIYYLNIGSLYKIGVCKDRGTFEKSINIRYKKELRNTFTVIDYFLLESGLEASILENIIKRENKEHLYKGSKRILDTSNTEVFNTDVINNIKLEEYNGKYNK